MEQTGIIEARIEEILDDIHAYGDLVSAHFELNSLTFHIIEGLLIGVPAVVTLMAAPEAAVIGLAAEGTAEIGFATGVFSTMGYVSAAMGAAGSIVELTIAGAEGLGKYKPSSVESKSLEVTRDISDPFSLIFGTALVVHDQILSSDGGIAKSPFDIGDTFERGIFVGKIASLMNELATFGNIARQGKSIKADSYQTLLQTATLGNPPQASTGSVEKVKNMVNQSASDAGLVPAEGLHVTHVESPQYSNLFSSDGTENGLGLHTLSLGNNAFSSHPENFYLFWEHSENDNITQMQNSSRNFGSGEFFDPTNLVPNENLDTTAAEPSIEPDINSKPYNEKMDTPPDEASLPPEIDGVEDTGKGILP